MSVQRRSFVLSVAGLSVAAFILAGCTTATDPESASSGGDVFSGEGSDVTSALEKWGWTPPAGANIPIYCEDDSYADAVKDGVVYGTYAFPPYFEEGPSDSEASGIEWEMLKTAAALAGIKVTYEIAPYDSLIPSIQSGRMDIMPVHETADRLAALSFSTPVYWYGPVIAVPEGNPAAISTFEDLVKEGVSVGVVKGSAAQIYMESVGGEITAFPDQNTELAALEAGRVSAVLEDSITLAEYVKLKPGATMEILKGKSLDTETLYDLGYGYFEYGFHPDACSLNMALSSAISQLRAQGVYLNILRDAGLEGLATVSIPGTEG